MNKKRKRKEISPDIEERNNSKTIEREDSEIKIKGKKASKLNKLFKGKLPINLLPTHEEEISPPSDYKISYQIRQALKTKDIMICTKLISQFGIQKKIDASLFLYCELIKAGIWPTIYTFTSIINACVRCYELKRAQTYLNDMKSIGIQPNDVTYTVLIKGYCQEGLIDQAIENLNVMKREEVPPNIRTYNTILRGCMRCGKLSKARQLISEMQNDGIEPDITSYEYFIKCLCFYLKVKEAWRLAVELKSKGIYQASIFSAIATSAALARNFRLAGKAKKYALESLQLNIVNTQGFKKSSSFSVDLFMGMRNDEIEKECARVEEYINASKEKKSQSNSEKTENKYRICNARNFVKKSKKIVFFSSAVNKNPKAINLKKIFGNELPIKLEICSGHGDWIVERANHDIGKVNWVALEIRFERVYTIFSKMIFRNLSNLVILAGEAKDILLNCIKPRIFDEIFINYPDPPVWEKSQWLLIHSLFLKEVHRVLKKNRCITIVTDDREYSKIMVKEFKKSDDLYTLQ